MKKNKKLLALVCCMALLVGSVGATLAWLTAQTQTVTNTFTPSDINITLVETDTTKDNNGNDSKEFKMVPGDQIAKDPKVTVEAGSEPCWLFVEAVKNESFDDYLTYGVRDQWKALDETNYPGVYYWDGGVDALQNEFSTYILSEDTINSEYANGYVTVLDTVGKDDMKKLIDGAVGNPTLTFKAYAIQKAHFDDVEKAWKEIKGL